MIAPTGIMFWQAFAQGRAGPARAIAPDPAVSIFRLVGGSLRTKSCPVSPVPRSGPSLAGPTLSCKPAPRHCLESASCCWHFSPILVGLVGSGTLTRCWSSCKECLSPTCCWLFPSRAACLAPQRAAFPDRPKRLRLPNRSVSAGWRDAASSLACRPAAKPTHLTASRQLSPSQTNRACRPNGYSCFAC